MNTSMPGLHRRVASRRVALQVVAILAIACQTGLTGCVRLDSLWRLRSVQSAVAAGAGVSAATVSVNLTNGRYLEIAVDNGATADETRADALRLAQTAYAAYELRSTLEQVTITFPAVDKAFFVVSRRRVDDDHIFRFRSSDLIATAGADRTEPEPPESASLYLLRAGNTPGDLVGQLEDDLRKRFPISLTVLPSLALGPAMYDEHRGQVVADSVIATIRVRYATLLREPGARIIAITGDDMYISTSNWRFAFSLRDPGDRIAVVSYARMRPEVFGNAPDAALTQSRLRKMVTKNIGIMCYRLPVSRNPRSVLYASIGGTDELDVMTEAFDPLDGVAR